MKLKLPFSLELHKIAEICGGILKGKNLTVKFISTDTRKDVSDSLFVPIKGERFDGHNFISEAFQKGAVASFCSKGFPVSFEPVIFVDDTLEALLKLGSYIRQKTGIFAIAVGGSSGKTTTKELTHFILSQMGIRAKKSEKSFNNNIGLSLSLLSVEKNTEVGVFEIGTSKKGEIEYLTKFADPDLAVLISVGKEHLEGLMDEHGVFEEETKLIDYVVNKEEGIPSVNIGNDKLREYFDGIQKRKIGFATQKEIRMKNGIFIFSEILETDELFNSRFKIKVNGETLFISTNLAPHFGEAIAGAISATVGFFLKQGGKPKDVLEEIKNKVDFREFKNQKGRFRVFKTKNIFVVDDTYNSNPTSVEAMFWSASFQKGRKIFVLGDMLELGKESEKEHRNIGNMAKKYFREDEALFIVSGEFAKYMAEGLRKSQFQVIEAERKDILSHLRNLVRDGNYVFFKASRKCKFEEILYAFAGNVE